MCAFNIFWDHRSSSNICKILLLASCTSSEKRDTQELFLINSGCAGQMRCHHKASCLSLLLALGGAQHAAPVHATALCGHILKFLAGHPVQIPSWKLLAHTSCWYNFLSMQRTCLCTSKATDLVDLGKLIPVLHAWMQSMYIYTWIKGKCILHMWQHVCNGV